MDLLKATTSLFHFYVPNSDGILLVILTWGIFLLAMSGLVRHSSALSKTENELKEIKNVPAEDTSTFFPSTNLAKAIIGLKEGVIRRYSEMMHLQGELADVDKRSLLDIAFEEMHAKLALPRNAPNLCMLSGLAGTIIGLALVVKSLGPQILIAANAGSPQEMGRPLALSIGTLGTAFASTLNGITAAGILSYLIARAERRQNLLQSQVEEWGLSRLSPLIFPKTLQSQLSQLQQNVLTVGKLMGEVSETLKSASAGMQAQIERFEESTKESTASIKQFEENTKQAALILGKSVLTMGDLQTKVHETYTSLMQRHDTAEENFQKRVESVISTVDKMQSGFNSNSTVIVERLQSAAENYAMSTTAFQEASVNFQNMSRQIGDDAYKAIAMRADQFNDALQAHKQSVIQTESSVRELMARVDPTLVPNDKWESLLASLDLIQETVAALSPQAPHQEPLKQLPGELSR